MISIPTVLVRGGTSRGLIFREEDLSQFSEAERQTIFAKCVGSPDPSGRQVNGVGGGNATTSKVAIVAASDRPDVDIDYTFYQVDVATGRSELRGTCGNLTSAVAQFAVDEGLAKISEPVTCVRIFNTNTNGHIHVEVPVSNGRAAQDGDFTLPGVPGTGAPIQIKFMCPGGAVTEKLLPTGQIVDSIELNGKTVRVSAVDVVNPLVLVDMVSLGISAIPSPPEMEADSKLMADLEYIRAWAAVKMELAQNQDVAKQESPTLPFVGMVSAPQTYVTSSGHQVRGESINAVVRLLSTGTAHRAVPLSAGIASAAQVCLRGSVACFNSQLSAPGIQTVRLGHPSGTIEFAVTLEGDDAQVIQSIGVTLTARRIMEGVVWV